MTTMDRGRAPDPERETRGLRLITFEEAQLAALLDQQMRLLESGEINLDSVAPAGAAATEINELLDIAALLQLRGKTRRELA